MCGLVVSVLVVSVIGRRRRVATGGCAVRCLLDHLPSRRGQPLARVELEHAGMNLYPLDTPLVGFGQPGAYRFDDNAAGTNGVLYATLFDNCWGTNFAQWQSGDFSFDFVLSPTGNDDWDGGLARGGAEVFRPLVASVCRAGRGPASRSLLKVDHLVGEERPFIGFGEQSVAAGSGLFDREAALTVGRLGAEGRLGPLIDQRHHHTGSRSDAVRMKNTAGEPGVHTRPRRSRHHGQDGCQCDCGGEGARASAGHHRESSIRAVVGHC